MQNNNMIQTIDNIAWQISKAKEQRKEELKTNIKDIETTEDFVMIRISGVPNSEWCFILKKDKTVTLAPSNLFSDNTYALIDDSNQYSDIDQKVNKINDKISKNEHLDKIIYGTKTYNNITLKDFFKEKTKKDKKIMNKLKKIAKQNQLQCCDMIKVLRQPYFYGQPWSEILLKPVDNRLEEFEYTYDTGVEDITINVVIDNKGKCKSVNVVSPTHQYYGGDEIKDFEVSVKGYLKHHDDINILNMYSFFCHIAQADNTEYNDMSQKWKKIINSDLHKIQNSIKKFKNNYNQFAFNLSERIERYQNIAKTIEFINKKRVELQDKYNKYKVDIDNFIKKLESDNKGKLRNFEKFLKTTKKHLLDELKQSASIVTLDRVGFLQYDITNNTISMSHAGSREQFLQQNKFLLELNSENKLSCLKYHDPIADKFITILPKYDIEYQGKKYHLEECMLFHTEGLIAPFSDKSDDANTNTNTYISEVKKNIIKISELRQIEKSQYYEELKHRLSSKTPSYNKRLNIQRKNINVIGSDNDIWNNAIKLKPRRIVENKKKIHVNLVKNIECKNR